MKTLLLFLIIGTSSFSYCQSNIVASGGIGISNNGATISYSVGQIDFIEINGVVGSLNFGNQQPLEIFELSIENPVSNINLLLYPNPTTSFVTLQFDEKNFENFYFSLYDITGKQVEKQSINANITTISLDNQAASTYFLSVYSDSNTLLKSYKIIKKWKT